MPQPSDVDEFGQDTLMGLSEFETFIDAMDAPSALRTADEINGFSAFAGSSSNDHSGMSTEHSVAATAQLKTEHMAQPRETGWDQSASGDISNTPDFQTHADRSAQAHLDTARSSLASSMTAGTGTSTDLMSEAESSGLSSISSLDASSESESKSGRTSETKASRRIKYDVRPRASIPTDMAASEYARQCISAAESSRLNPYALHVDEHKMLREHLTPAQVTTYLNIRNGILRLWVRNPLIGVMRDEAIGCARDARWFDVANLCYEWLVRNGFINYGCLDIQQDKGARKGKSSNRQRTVAVIGAGMAGLGCARQLEGLFAHYRQRFKDIGEDPPKVVVVEGRDRVGGRVYSRQYQSDTSRTTLKKGNRCTAEMGGMIITGFERGNPLNILVRGQLALDYHGLRPTTTIYDSNGQPVEQRRDQLAENLYNDILDRVSDYKFKLPILATAEGDHEMVDSCRDSHAEHGKTIAQIEEEAKLKSQRASQEANTLAPFEKAPVDVVPVSTDKLTGRVHTEPGIPAVFKAAYKARKMGWALKDGVTDDKDLELEGAVGAPGATLGSVMDAAIQQYRDVVHILPLDLRLVNWHVANLEYSNAINYSQLSLAGWDVDAGNEWEGKHTQIVGGYQQVPRGLLHCPYPLNVEKNKKVVGITYRENGDEQGPSILHFENGSMLPADLVINTMPLGVLKSQKIEFNPPLPEWKTGAIERLGFGVLNKVVLVFKEAFWDTSRDIFGVLREATQRASLSQSDYSRNRGRFFQWFNATKTSGVPTLIALMAGDAAFQTENETNASLVTEAVSVLRTVFGAKVSHPVEAIVTRWGSDPFALGSYSCTGPDFRHDDYETMARPIGSLFFAGEHTCGTHPATVHGAYISGLRAASEIIDSLLGPINVPTPLILPKETDKASLKRKAMESARESKDLTTLRLQAYEAEIWAAIYAKFGEYPIPPAKPSANPYILFNKAHFEDARRKCEEGRRPGKGKPAPNEVRVMLAKMWKELSEEERKPFTDRAREAKEAYAQELEKYKEKALKWDTESLAFRRVYEQEHPSVPSREEIEAQGMESPGRRGRRVRVVGGYKEDSDVELEGMEL